MRGHRSRTMSSLVSLRCVSARERTAIQSRMTLSMPARRDILRGDDERALFVPKLPFRINFSYNAAAYPRAAGFSVLHDFSVFFFDSPAFFAVRGSFLQIYSLLRCFRSGAHPPSRSNSRLMKFFARAASSRTSLRREKCERFRTFVSGLGCSLRSCDYSCDFDDIVDSNFRKNDTLLRQFVFYSCCSPSFRQFRRETVIAAKRTYYSLKCYLA